MDIPTIGGPKGIFEIFVPGVFLLLNAAGTIYFSSLIDEKTRQKILENVSTPGLGPFIGLIGLVIIICFGYLIGILIRLLRVEVLDRWSGAWLRRFDPGARQKDGSFKRWASENFPYLGWLEETCKLNLPAEALDFYNKTWGLRKREEGNTRFFNFCKALVISIDEHSANEIYVAEALCRYLIGMFCSLSLASCLIIFIWIFEPIFSRNITSGFIFLLIPYVVAIGVILHKFRTIRVKEASTVFDATFINRERLEASLLSQVEEPRHSKRRRIFWIMERRL